MKYIQDENTKRLASELSNLFTKGDRLKEEVKNAIKGDRL